MIRLHIKAVHVLKPGQVISKGFFGVFYFFQKMNENTLHSSKNDFIFRFLEEFMAWHFAMEINDLKIKSW